VRRLATELASELIAIRRALFGRWTGFMAAAEK
jgi:hypothetical protein